MKEILKYVKHTNWKTVFASWRKNEATDKNWIKYYEKKGFKSWESWRMIYAKSFGLTDKKWDLYKILEPLKTVSRFKGGPFRGWNKNFYHGKKFLSFVKLAKEFKIKKHKKINQLTKNFPKKTTLIGLEVGKEIVIIEGMHRCCAIALMKDRKQKLNSELYIFLASYVGKKLPLTP